MNKCYTNFLEQKKLRMIVIDFFLQLTFFYLDPPKRLKKMISGIYTLTCMDGILMYPDKILTHGNVWTFHAYDKSFFLHDIFLSCPVIKQILNKYHTNKYPYAVLRQAVNSLLLSIIEVSRM